MTKQGVVDQIYNWYFIKNNTIPTNESDDAICVYTDHNGAHCAVGIFIGSDERILNGYNEDSVSDDEVWDIVKDYLQIETYDDSLSHLFWNEIQQMFDVVLGYPLNQAYIKLYASLKDFCEKESLVFPQNHVDAIKL